MTLGKTQLICPGLRETKLQALLHGGKTLSQYSSDSGKMVLKRPFLNDTGEDSTHLFRPLRGIADQVNMIGLLGRWSCKGHAVKPLHIHSGSLGDRAH